MAAPPDPSNRRTAEQSSYRSVRRVNPVDRSGIPRARM